MTVYLDNTFMCHAEPGEGRTPYQTSDFDGKCVPYIESFRIIPEGKFTLRNAKTEPPPAPPPRFPLPHAININPFYHENVTSFTSVTDRMVIAEDGAASA